MNEIDEETISRYMYEKAFLKKKRPRKDTFYLKTKRLDAFKVGYDYSGNNSYYNYKLQ